MLPCSLACILFSPISTSESHKPAISEEVRHFFVISKYSKPKSDTVLQNGKHASVSKYALHNSYFYSEIRG